LLSLQRAAGRAQLSVRCTPAGTAIHTLHQRGCLKLRFPRTRDGGLEAVLINLSGGVTDGDALSLQLDVGEGARLGLCTPAAERIYRAMPGAQPARIDTQIRVGARARLDYLPQETLFFDSAALARTLAIDIAPDATFLGVEARLFGRALSGEAIGTLRLTDRLTLRRGGRLILHDTLRLAGDAAAILAAPAVAGGHKAAATILYAAPDAPAFVSPLRMALGGVEAGASTWNGILLARLLAPDGHVLRRALLPALELLLQKPLPRLWAS
jgi:urease accessory protein